jgi:hypothetical protein
MGKTIALISALSVLLTYGTLFISIRVPLPSWTLKDWLVLALLMTFGFSLLVLVTVYRFHMRTVELFDRQKNGLKTMHEREIEEIKMQHQSATNFKDEHVRRDTNKLINEKTRLAAENENLKAQREQLTKRIKTLSDILDKSKSPFRCKSLLPLFRALLFGSPEFK